MQIEKQTIGTRYVLSLEKFHRRAEVLNLKIEGLQKRAQIPHRVVIINDKN